MPTSSPMITTMLGLRAWASETAGRTATKPRINVSTRKIFVTTRSPVGRSVALLPAHLSAQHSLFQIFGRRLGAQPDREDGVREALPLEDAQLLALGGERRPFARQVRERHRGAFLHVGNEGEHLVERGLLGGPILHVRLEAFLEGLDELRLRQV